jgi:hypothetical protein
MDMAQASGSAHQSSIAGRIVGIRRVDWAGRSAVIGAVLMLAGSVAVTGAGESNSTDAAAIDEAVVSALDPTNASVVLAYKFQPGQFIRYESANRVQHVAQVPGRDPAVDQPDVERYVTRQKNESEMYFRVVSVDDHGTALVEPVIDRVRMTAILPGKEPVVYDSTSDGPVPREFQVIHQSLGRAVARFQVAPTGKLIKAIVTDANAPQVMRDAAEKLETRFSCLTVMPSTPVRVGDKWRENYNTSILIGKSLKQPIPMVRIYELTGIRGGLATIQFKTVILAPVDDPEHERQLVQQTPSGTIQFDIGRGLVRSHVSTLNKTIVNALGPQTLLEVVGEATEKLVLPADDSGQPRVSQISRQVSN